MTVNGNRSIAELKRGIAVEAVNKLKSEQKELMQEVSYLEDKRKVVADRYEADTFKLGVLHGDYTDGTDDLPEYASISRISRQKVVLPLEAYQKEQRALKAAREGEQASTAELESVMQNATMQYIKQLEEREKEQCEQIKKLTKKLNDLKQDYEYDKIDLQIKQQIVDGINRVYWKLGLKASSEFIEAWKKEVHEKLPVAWQHTIDRSQEITESHQRKSIKELREEADKLLGKSYNLRDKLRGAYESLTNVVKAVGMLKYDREKDQNGNYTYGKYGISNLSKAQEKLIDGLAEYGAKWAKEDGFPEMAEEMEKHVGISKGIEKIVEPPAPKRSKGWEMEL